LRALFTSWHQFFGGVVVSVLLGVTGGVVPGAGAGVVEGIEVSAGGGVPVPVVPVVPLVPEVAGAVVVVSPGGAMAAVSLFLQAPSMAAMTAAVRMIFDVAEIAFIVLLLVHVYLVPLQPAKLPTGGQQRLVSHAMNLMATQEGTIREPTQRDTRPRSVHEFDCEN
jgi:hypothetical protein